ncbi:hypothetical protein E3C22_01190 [Jiella endophytica]|uniref:Glycosyltransferase RgtA/B/C/D-like domain-containing protein n=1 Tax=Jiella endophytica TaxID=2558362 RepID=A0A4Y8RSC0_9HYPH|nr:hypothetical protein [Jiella endophytica]TFF27126.1 hypothetical protein E3C22_01190 [Jiella endophytica]
MTLAPTASRPGSLRLLRPLASPLVIVPAVCAVLACLLMTPLTVPIGAFYWDLFIYFDAANRIFSGQVPGLDFFTPVGPLGYWLFALCERLFPSAQPLLLVQWSLLIVTGPLIALVAHDVDRRSRALALALLLPFLVFQILPINVTEYYSYPSVDGFGIYNRQITEILYVLVAALVFARSRRIMLAVIVTTMLALFLIKVTGFFAGGLLCVVALLARRIDLRLSLAAALGFLLVLAGLELWLGVVSAYLGDIAALLALNEESLLPRFLQAASIHFTVFGPLALLMLLLLVLDGRDMVDKAKALFRSPGASSLAALVDRPLVWIAAATFAALFVETQNTGGQGFIFVWPVLLMAWDRRGRIAGTRLGLLAVLIAAASLPYLTEVTARAARAFVGQIKYERLAGDHLGQLGLVSQRSEIMHHAEVMKGIFAAHPETYEAIATAGELPNFTLYNEPDFQLAWLMAVDEAVGAINAFEAEHDVRFGTIMSLNFTNPFPWLLGREAPKGIAIGADPFRAVPDPDAAILSSVEATDLVLYPRCPITDANEKLRDLYAPALEALTKITLSPCWEAYVAPDVAAKLGTKSAAAGPLRPSLAAKP